MYALDSLSADGMNPSHARGDSIAIVGHAEMDVNLNIPYI